jgi:SPP1 gp7 family putative phage head morphogenesis protein
MLDLLAAHARSLRGPSDIDEVVGRWADQLQADDRLAGLLYRTSFQAALGGQLMVREVELAEDVDSAARAVVSRRESPFLAMPFNDAVAFFRAKRLISEEEFDALRDRYREGGFIARRLATDRLREVARTSIARLLEQDLTTDEVYEAIRAAERDEVLSMGIAPASPHYLETVVRTNVATAYGAGRWQAVNDPDVAALRPYLRYVTAGDEAVRPMHRALHGRVFRTGTEEAAYYAPPLGFRCRCSLTTISARQFEARGYVLTEGRIAGVTPDAGWESAPGPLTD